MKNSDLDDRTAIDDLFAIADKGLNARRIVQCNENTLNTPYKAGLTAGRSGTAYINMSATNYGTILYIVSGTNRVFLRAKDNGTWSNWEELLKNADIKIFNLVTPVTNGSNIVTGTVPGLKVGKACLATVSTTTSNYILCAAATAENTIQVRFANNFSGSSNIRISVVFEP